MEGEYIFWFDNMRGDLNPYLSQVFSFCQYTRGPAMGHSHSLRYCRAMTSWVEICKQTSMPDNFLLTY
jgi:hypothetical protein